jgi:hypothetical protein
MMARWTHSLLLALLLMPLAACREAPGPLPAPNAGTPDTGPLPGLPDTSALPPHDTHDHDPETTPAQDSALPDTGPAADAEPAPDTPDRADTPGPDVLPGDTTPPADALDEPPDEPGAPTLAVMDTESIETVFAALDPFETGVILLQARRGDVLRFVLRNRDESDWQGEITLWGPGDLEPWRSAEGNTTEGLVLGTGTDGGLTLDRSGPWEVQVRNLDDEFVRLRVEITCLGGPCAGETLIEDLDGDGIPDLEDNCPLDANPGQEDTRGNGYGDACDGVDPWPDLSTAALRLELRRQHTLSHRNLTYTPARRVMFSLIDNDEGEVACLYTALVVTTSDIPDESVMNTEHIWPQSRGAGVDPMRSDLHHLAPTSSRANSSRGNLVFCEVVRVEVQWDESARGVDADGRSCFQPAPRSRGNIARSLFYFSAVYNTPIDPREEVFLRRWHADDPPDARERLRNELVRRAQGSRNHFIDYPHLVERIPDF